MEILMDTANMKEIEIGNDIFPIDGVTTNPTIISKEKTECVQVLKNIRKIIGPDKMIHAQVISTTFQGMVEEAEYLNEKTGKNLYVKIPVIPEGIKTIKILSQRGIKITATAVFTPQQALMAAKAGAEYVAPYVNRLDNISGDGIKVVSEIVNIFNLYNIKTKVLAASFKNVEQVQKSCLAGAHAVTVSNDILNNLIYHPLTDMSVKKFVEDWEDAFGKKKLIDNI